MIFKKVFLIIFVFLLFPFMANAETIWVTPTGAGDKSGSSEDNAIDGLLNVVWGEGAGKVGPGDTLKIVGGVHVHNAVAYGNIITQGDITPVTGTEENPITLDFNGTVDGIWLGGMLSNYNPWVQEEAPNTNVWRNSIDVNREGAGYWWDGSTNPLTYITNIPFDTDLATTLATVHATENSAYWDSSERDIYVHVTGGVDPSHGGDGTMGILTPSSGCGYEFQWSGIDYFNIINMVSYGGAWSFDTNDGIKFTNCKIWQSMGTILPFNGACDDILVLNCDIGYAANGFYAISDTNDTTTNSRIAYNAIHHMGTVAGTENSDAHGISFQGGHDSIIEGNKLWQCHRAILNHVYTFQDQYNFDIRYNWVLDPHQYESNGTYGISTQCDTGTLSNKSNYKIYDNVVEGHSVGFRFQYETEQEFFNNIAYNNTSGMNSARNVHAIQFDGATYDFQQDDVVTNGLGQTATIDGVLQSPGAETGTLTFDSGGDSFTDGNNLIVGGSTRAQANGDSYNLGANVKSRNNYFLSNTKHIKWTSGADTYTINTDYNRYYPDGADLFYTTDDGDMTFAEYAALAYINDAHSAIEELPLTNPAGGDFTPSSSLPTGEDQGSYNLLTDSSGPIWPTGTGGGTFSFDDPDSFGWFIGAIGQGSSITRTLLGVTITGGKTP